MESSFSPKSTRRQGRSTRRRQTGRRLPKKGSGEIREPVLPELNVFLVRFLNDNCIDQERVRVGCGARARLLGHLKCTSSGAASRGQPARIELTER